MPSTISTSENVKKVLMVGTTGLGNTTLLTAFLKSEFPIPLSRKNCLDVSLDGGEKVRLDFQELLYECHTTIRTLDYSNADAVLLYFPYFPNTSFDALEKLSVHWFLEISILIPSIPVLVVACEELYPNSVAEQEVFPVLENPDCPGYSQCSTETGVGIRELLKKVAKTVLGLPDLAG